MKKTYKIIFAIFLINLSIAGKAYANEEDDTLKAEIKDAVRETVDGKLYYQVNIKTVYGVSDVDIYMANTDTDNLPSASTIKPFIGLTIMDKVQKGEMFYTEQIKKDLDLSLRLSDNDATNRLINAVGGFDQINYYIKNFTKKDRTKLNRMMMASGRENTANAKDLSWAIYEIYRNDNIVANDMKKSLSNSSMKRVKLLKNVNPSYKTMNKTGELSHIENDLVLIETGSQAYIISLLTENNNYMDTYNQILLINKLGEKVARAYENYENIYKIKKETEKSNLTSRLNTSEKKLAYALYNNQMFVNAGEILLESDNRAVDEIRPYLIEKINESREILEKSKNALINYSKEPIMSEEDMLVNIVRLIYTNKELNSDINRNLALAFYKNKATVKAGEILLNDSPKTSLDIRRPLLRNIKASEDILEKAELYFEKLNAEN